MSSEVSLSPVGRREIHQLEYALLIGALFRPEIAEALKNPTERLTWLDALAVAAAALARQKAKMPVSQIAEELGRTEATIRNHLSGKTEAGRLVLKTYEEFAKQGVKIELPLAAGEKRLEELEKRLLEAKKDVEQALTKVKELEDALQSLAEKL